MLTAAGRQIGAGTYKITGTNAWKIETRAIKSEGSIAADGKTMSIHEIAPYDLTLVLDKT